MDLAAPSTGGVPRFAEQLCDELFGVQLVDDLVYPDAKLPASIHLNYTQEQYTQCYYISRQIWKEADDLAVLVAIVDKLFRTQSLSPSEQVTFKHIRARFKLLRLAYILFDHHHVRPMEFHWLTGLMGNLQDSFKNGRSRSVVLFAMAVRSLLTSAPFHLATRRIDAFRPSTEDHFRLFIEHQINTIRARISQTGLSGKAFHETRKIVSRQVGIYGILKTLYPSSYHKSIFEHLSTINGLMGDAHDELVSRRFQGTQRYYSDKFPIPSEIRQRLIDFTVCYDTTTSEQ